MAVNRKQHYTDGSRRKLIIGATVVVVGAAYIWHRRVLDSTIVSMTMLMEDSTWESFDEGVRYGIQLAKDTVVESSASTKELLELGKPLVQGRFS